LESNGYIHYDYGGNAGGTEVSMMILDHFLYSQSKAALNKYFPVVNLTLQFFHDHYKNRTADGQLVIWPTQALETYWCAWPPVFEGKVGDPAATSNCIVNDLPTVVALHVLLERVLLLPSDVVPADEQAKWLAFQAILPPVPVTTENGYKAVSPYESYPVNSKLHNGETPELYGIHPYRYYSAGRKLLGKTDTTPAENCFLLGSKIRATCGNGQNNGGWTQGIMNAALLGIADVASSMAMARAKTAPAAGYRFQGFAPHEQDYEPSADHFANMNSALNWMLVQPADDAAGSSLVFAAWPCEWDVDFKLHAPMNTTVEAVLKNKKLVRFVVTPASRAPYVHVVNCGGNSSSTGSTAI